MGITTLFLLCSFVVGVLRADDCLPKEDIWPCECSSSTAYLRNIECTHILKSEELIPPMRAIEKTKTKVDVLTIKYSSLSHLPDNIFRNTYIKKIEFLNTSIVSLTESGTPFHGLENILEHMQAMDVTFVSGLHFDQFRSLRKLKGINLDRCSMHSAVHHLPHLPELTSLRITNSEIAHISNKAFGSLPKLTVFDMQSNEITEVKRSMFSKPANSLEWIDLSNNILSSLPSDFFEKMPKIKKLYLQNNELVTLSAIPFSDVLRNGQLQEIHMTGNPLHCDCKISWLGSIRFPKEFHAKCSKPEAYSGKDISSLDFKSFRLEICNGDFLRLLLAYAKLSK